MYQEEIQINQYNKRLMTSIMIFIFISATILSNMWSATAAQQNIEINQQIYLERIANEKQSLVIQETLLKDNRGFRKLIKSGKFNEYYSLASDAINNGEYLLALANINMCFDYSDKDNASIMQDLWVKKGCLEAVVKKYDKALESLSKVSNDNKLMPQIVQTVVQIYVEKGDIAGANEYTKGYLDINPSDTIMQGLHAELAYLSGDYAAAIDAYGLLIETQRDESGIFSLMRGFSYQQINQHENAIESILDAVEYKNIDKALCYEHIALSEYMLGNNEDVLQVGNLSIDIGSDQVDYAKLYYFMGLASLQLGDYASSVDSLSEAIEISEQINDTYYYRGVGYMVLEKYLEAIDDFSISIDNEIETGLCYYNRGICYMQANELDKAKCDFTNVSKHTTQEDLVSSAQGFLELL